MSAGPQSTEPIGAPRPFERQNIIVVDSAAISDASTPEATAALKIRAPSRWTGTPASSATFRTARSLERHHATARSPTVFSTDRRSTTSTS